MTLSAIIVATVVGQTFSLPKKCTYKYWNEVDRLERTESYGATTCAECTNSIAKIFHNSGAYNTTCS